MRKGGTMGAMRAAFLISCLLAAVVPAARAQGRRAFTGQSMFSDIRSYQANDIVTIIVSETSRGANSASTQQDKQQRSRLGIGGFGSLDALDFGLDMDNRNDYDANASTARNNVLQARIAAVVREVTENGNLSIEGKKEILINGEMQTMTLSGIVRPQDVRADNTVYSSKIAGMKIGLSGEGTVAQGSTPGILARIFHILF